MCVDILHKGDNDDDDNNNNNNINTYTPKYFLLNAVAGPFPV
jgi:hypothetical protein